MGSLLCGDIPPPEIALEIESIFKQVAPYHNVLVSTRKVASKYCTSITVIEKSEIELFRNIYNIPIQVPSFFSGYIVTNGNDIYVESFNSTPLEKYLEQIEILKNQTINIAKKKGISETDCLYMINRGFPEQYFLRGNFSPDIKSVPYNILDKKIENLSRTWKYSLEDSESRKNFINEKADEIMKDYRYKDYEYKESEESFRKNLVRELYKDKYDIYIE